MTSILQLIQLEWHWEPYPRENLGENWFGGSIQAVFKSHEMAMTSHLKAPPDTSPSRLFSKKKPSWTKDGDFGASEIQGDIYDLLSQSPRPKRLLSLPNANSLAAREQDLDAMLQDWPTSSYLMCDVMAINRFILQMKTWRLIEVAGTEFYSPYLLCSRLYLTLGSWKDSHCDFDNQNFPQLHLR